MRTSMTRKLWRSVAIVPLLAAGLSACGGGDGGDRVAAGDASGVEEGRSMDPTAASGPIPTQRSVAGQLPTMGTLDTIPRQIDVTASAAAPPTTARTDPPPPTAPVPSGDPALETLSADTSFGATSAELTPAGIADLEHILAAHGGCPVTATAVGRTDWRGTSHANQILSTQRADAVRAWLVLTCPTSVVEASGVGELDAHGPGATEAEMADDRRVDLSLTFES